MRKILAWAAALLAASTLDAQTALTYSAKGTVYDAGTLKPVEAVSVTVPGRNYSTVSNADGSFVIKSDQALHELSFSRIGYRSCTQAVTGGEISVMMIPVAYPIKEASIVSGDPLAIVLAACDKIKENYPSEPELLRCFYRETLQKRQRFISVNEAVARVFKTPYRIKSTGADKTALEKSRVIMSQRKHDTLSVRMMGGPTIAASFDIVKNPGIIFEDIDLQLYSLKMESPAYIGDRLHFVISLTPAGTAEYPLYYGTLYIDRESLTFSRIELSLDMRDTNKATRMMLVRKPLGLRFYPKELRVAVNYSRQDGVSRLGYCRTTMSFSCDWKKRLFATNYTSVNELVVTDLITPAVQIPREEVFRPKDILDDKAPLFLDSDFWKDYNIIEPSESLENAVKRLKKHN